MLYEGMQIYVVPDHQRYVPDPTVPISKELYDKLVEWAPSLGFTNILMDGEVWQMRHNNQVHMNPRTYDQFKKVIFETRK